MTHVKVTVVVLLSVRMTVSMNWLASSAGALGKALF